MAEIEIDQYHARIDHNAVSRVWEVLGLPECDGRYIWQHVEDQLNAKQVIIDANSQLVTALAEALQMCRTLLSTLEHFNEVDRVSLTCALDLTANKVNSALALLNPPPTQLPLEHTKLKAEREDGL